MDRSLAAKSDCAREEHASRNRSSIAVNTDFSSPPLAPPSQGGEMDRSLAAKSEEQGDMRVDPHDHEESTAFPGDPGMAWRMTRSVSPQPPQQVVRAKARVKASFSRLRIAPHWFHHDTRFWYRNELPARPRSLSWSTPNTGREGPAFDHEKLAAALSKAVGGEVYKADQLPFDTIEFVDDSKAILFQVGGRDLEVRLGFAGM